MRHRSARLGTTAALLALLATAACSSERASADEALLRDLDQASAVGIELAPSAEGRAVVSAIESTPATKRAATPQRTTRAPAPRATRAPAPRADVAQAPAPDAEPAAAPAPRVETTEPRPTTSIPRPTPTPTRRGGYSTTADVIRNAPFPILP